MILSMNYHLFLELLQHRATTIIYADEMIRRTIQLLENLIDNEGTKSLEA